jgi:hypothetical protein
MKASGFGNLAVHLRSRLFAWRSTAAMTTALAFAGMILVAGMSGPAFAARKTCDDGSYPPCRDTGEEEAGNRLSYPAVLIPGISIVPFFGALEGELGVTWSYGCPGTETLEQYEYPNVSCVDNLAEPSVYYTAEECIADGGKCAGLTVDRIYWQKQEDNTWSAQATALTGGVDQTPLPVTIRFLDWGDSIEVVSWNETSVLRVETQPFVDLSQDPLVELGATQTQYGFQMWHVSGQGTTEHWGVRTTEDEFGWQGLPYAYQSPYAIINGGTADLYLSKLFREAADDEAYGCPVTGGDQPPAYPLDYGPDEWGFTFPGRIFTADEGWSNACNLPLVAYTLEQSVSGKFVHGYNWSMRELTNPLPLALCGDATWQKTGWWRLTFVPNGGADKMAFNSGTVASAPIIPEAIPTVFLPALAEESEDETEGTLYTPSIDPGNNLSYIDICIVKKVKSGGKK